MGEAAMGAARLVFVVVVEGWTGRQFVVV